MPARSHQSETEIRVQQDTANALDALEPADDLAASPQRPATDESSPSAHIMVLSWIALIAAVITYVSRISCIF